MSGCVDNISHHSCILPVHQSYLQTYHCRLRRRHMELDFDGGDSIEILKPYLNEDELSEKKGTPLAKGISNPSASTPEPPREAPASPGDVASLLSAGEIERKAT